MKKVLSLFLSLVMLFSCLAGVQLTAHAETDYKGLSSEVYLNTGWSGVITQTETEDYHWYHINIPSDGKFTLKVLSHKSYTEYSLYNYDLTDCIIDDICYGSVVEPTTETNVRILSAGDYYLKFYGATGNYQYCAEFESYNANDFGANTYLSPLDLPQNYLVTGALTETDDVDWYRIYVPATGTYQFKLTGYKNYSDLDFYNSDLSKTIYDRRVYASETEPKVSVDTKSLSPGTYYIKMTGDYGKYTFSWSVLTPENCTHDFSSKKVSATCVSNGYTTYTCKICGLTYNDNFTPYSSHITSSTTVYPTYFAGGYTLHTCKVCGASYADSYTSKISVYQSSIYSIKGGKKKIALSISMPYGINGVQIQYSTSKKFTKKTTKSLKTAKSTKTISKLKAKKKYYVRVRSYVVVNGKKAYSSWSPVKSVKTK